MNPIAIIVIVVLVILALMLFKLEHHGKRVKLFIIIVIALLVASSIFTFSKSEEANLTNPRGIIKTGYSYISWVGHSIANLWDSKEEIRDIVGDAVRFNSSQE